MKNPFISWMNISTFRNVKFTFGYTSGKGMDTSEKKIIHSTIVAIQIQQAILAQAFWLRKK